jgi:hypothetical protein
MEHYSTKEYGGADVKIYVIVILYNEKELEECRLLGCYAVRFLSEPTLRRNVSPPLSE